jgi:hypothetical protein
LRGIKRKQRTRKENFEALMLEDYEKQKYGTQGHLSSDEDDVSNISRFESLDEIDYLFSDDEVYISSFIS